MTPPIDKALAPERDEIFPPSAPVDTMRRDVSGPMANEAWGDLQRERATSSPHHRNSKFDANDFDFRGPVYPRERAANNPSSEQMRRIDNLSESDAHAVTNMFNKRVLTRQNTSDLLSAVEVDELSSEDLDTLSTASSMRMITSKDMDAILDFEPNTRSAVSETMAEQIKSRKRMLPDATQHLVSEGQILERWKNQGLIQDADIPAILDNPSSEASINRVLFQQSKLPADKKLDYETLNSVIQLSRNSETSDSTIKVYRDAILNGEYGIVKRILGESKENRQAYEQVWSNKGESVAQLLEQQNSNLPEDKRLDVLSVNTLISRYRDGKLSSSLLDQYRKDLLDGTVTNTEVRAVSEYPPNPDRIAALDHRVRGRNSQQESALSFLLDPKNIEVTKKVAAKISSM